MPTMTPTMMPTMAPTWSPYYYEGGRRLRALTDVEPSPSPDTCTEDKTATNSYGITCESIASIGHCNHTEEGLWPGGQGDGTSNLLACPISCLHTASCPCLENPTATNSYGVSCATTAASGFCEYTQDGLWPNGPGDGTSSILACPDSCNNPDCVTTPEPRPGPLPVNLSTSMFRGVVAEPAPGMKHYFAPSEVRRPEQNSLPPQTHAQPQPFA